jgi:hypothetical protein
MSYFAAEFFAGGVSAWARASVVATSSQSVCYGSRSAPQRRFRVCGVEFDVLIGRKGDYHRVRSFPELVCAGENTARPGAQTVRRRGARPVRRQDRAGRSFSGFAGAPGTSTRRAGSGFS